MRLPARAAASVGPQARGPDDRRDDGVRAAACRGFDDAGLAAEDPRRQPVPAQRALEAARRIGIEQRGDVGSMAQAELARASPIGRWR